MPHSLSSLSLFLFCLFLSRSFSPFFGLFFAMVSSLSDSLIVETMNLTYFSGATDKAQEIVQAACIQSVGRLFVHDESDMSTLHWAGQVVAVTSDLLVKLPTSV